MTKSEFKEVAIDVFADLLPKVKGSDRLEFIDALAEELQAHGLEIEDEETDTVEEDESL